MHRLHPRIIHRAEGAARPLSLPVRGGISDVISYISQLDVQGIEDLQSRAHNKDEDQVRTDEELAWALFAEEAQGLLNVVKDRALEDESDESSTHSILEELEAMEEAARYDRLVALAIYEGEPIPPRPRRPTRSRAGPSLVPQISHEDDDSDDNDGEAEEDSSDESSAAGEHLWLPPMLATERNDSDVQETPAFFSSPEPISRSLSETSSDAEHYEREETCTVCGDSAPYTYTAPCGHSFDTECLDLMFRNATKDESLYPPKCCQERIPTSEASDYLGRQTVDAFLRKSIEFDTPNRVYCHKPRCSAFLGAAADEAISLECPECSAETCASCKAAAHSTSDCSDTQELNDMAKDMNKRQGWQRCPSCHHLVEKAEGCHHITCICSQQFCYLCAVPWKGCDCPQFDVPADV